MIISNKKVKILNDKINSIPPVDKNSSYSYSDPPDTWVKITAVSFDSTNKLNQYDWEGIKADGTYNDIIGKSTEYSRAICVQEMERDMTDLKSLAKVGNVVLLSSDINGFFFSVADLGEQKNFIEFGSKTSETSVWEIGTTEEGIKVKCLERMYYDHTVDAYFGCYRILTFSGNGILLKIDAVIKEIGFETTLHT